MTVEDIRRGMAQTLNVSGVRVTEIRVDPATWKALHDDMQKGMRFIESSERLKIDGAEIIRDVRVPPRTAAYLTGHRS